ncbi:hypothetical protein KP509_05G102400 [Ceratopteris richardii]|uniref:Uncharacterized protein n=1 Tax=Ceratopteris richardii TaxID=49495 RepID=A0A8T2UTG8_CERRI|nr:hypothetical protein KP509_05G102400 [Ceratopteris richardii]
MARTALCFMLLILVALLGGDAAPSTGYARRTLLSVEPDRVVSNDNFPIQYASAGSFGEHPLRRPNFVRIQQELEAKAFALKQQNS